MTLGLCSETPTLYLYTKKVSNECSQLPVSPTYLSIPLLFSIVSFVFPQRPIISMVIKERTWFIVPVANSFFVAFAIMKYSSHVVHSFLLPFIFTFFLGFYSLSWTLPFLSPLLTSALLEMRALLYDFSCLLYLSALSGDYLLSNGFKITWAVFWLIIISISVIWVSDLLLQPLTSTLESLINTMELSFT